MRKQNGIFLFNIIPNYRPGMSDVFDSVKLAALPSLAQRIKQNTFFGSLENICGQCLNEADLLYVFATDGDRDFAKINWKDPGNFTPTEVNTPTFTANEGFIGDGSSSYLNTGWSPLTNGINFTQNEGSAFAHSNTETAVPQNEFLFGTIDTGNNGRLHVIPKSQFSNHIYAVNSNGTDSVGTPTVSSQGFFHIRRTATNDTRLFKDGSQVGTTETSVNSTTMSSRNVLLLATQNNIGLIGNFYDGCISFFGIGASLSGQESALYTAWNTYFTSL